MIKDPELLKQILIKDFDHFTNHATLLSVPDPLLSHNLFIAKGKQFSLFNISQKRSSTVQSA